MTLLPAEGGETFGAALRRLRAAGGLSLAGLSRLVNYSRGYLSKLENRLAVPNMDLALFLDSKLGADGLLIRLAEAELAMGRGRSKRKTIVPSMLPPAPSNFHRDDDCLDEVLTAMHRSGTLVGEVPVAVLHGMAGIGKTALAVVAGHQLSGLFPDGCLFVDLHGYSDQPAGTMEILDTFLRLLGEDGDDIPTSELLRIALYRSHLREARILVVVDNARCSEQVKPFLPSGAGSALIATSRVPLPALDPTVSVAVGPLSTAAALRVLGGDPDSPGSVIEQIAARCAGHALALRIAASLLDNNSTTFQDILAAQLTEADRPATILQDGERQLTATLRAALDSMPVNDLDTLTRLVRYTGGALGAPAASWLLQRPQGPTEADLRRLYRAGLLTQDSHGRFGFHDLISPMVEDMAVGGRGDNDLQQLVAGYVHAVRAASRVLAPHRFQPAIAEPPPPQPLTFSSSAAATEWCFVELHNIIELISLSHSRRWNTACWQLAYGMRDYFFITKTLGEWIGSHRLAVQAADHGGDPWAAAVSRNNLGLALVESGDLAGGTAQYREAMKMFRRLGNHLGQAATYGHLAWASYCDAKFAMAERETQQALSLYQQYEDPRGYAINLRTLGLIWMQQSGRDAAGVFAEALQRFTDLGLVFDQAMVLNCLGELHMAHGALRLASGYFKRAIDKASVCHAIHEHARGIVGLADVTAASGHPQLSASLRERAQEIYAGWSHGSAEFG